MTQPHLRPYDPDTDRAALSEIWFEASRRAHGFIGEQRLSGQRRLIEDVYLPRAQTIVATRDGVPLGFISLLGDHVGGLFVTPGAQGQGIGRLLVDHARTLRDRLALEVYLDNPGACAFYARLGFVEQSRRDHDDEGLPFANALLVWNRQTR